MSQRWERLTVVPRGKQGTEIWKDSGTGIQYRVHMTAGRCRYTVTLEDETKTFCGVRNAVAALNLFTGR